MDDATLLATIKVTYQALADAGNDYGIALALNPAADLSDADQVSDVLRPYRPNGEALPIDWTQVT